MDRQQYLAKLMETNTEVSDSAKSKLLQRLSCYTGALSDVVLAMQDQVDSYRNQLESGWSQERIKQETPRSHHGLTQPGTEHDAHLSCSTQSIDRID